MPRRGNIWKKRREGMMAIFRKCEDLKTHTNNLTANKDRYPKSITFVLTHPIQEKAESIYSSLLECNEIFPETPNEFTERRRLQRKAIVDCKLLMSLIEYSMTRANLGERSAFYWGSLVLEVKYMAASWKNKDEKRFKHLRK